MAPPERAKTPAAFAAVPAVLASAVQPRERSARSCDEAPSKTATPAATLAVAAARVEEDSAEPRVTGTLKRSRSPPEIAEKRQAQAPDDVATVTSPQKLLAPAKAVTAPKLSPATAWPSKDGGRSGRAAKASIRCEPSPRQHPPPALTTTLTTAVEDLREEQRAGEPPAPSERKGGHPPLKTKLDGDSPSLTARPSKDGGRSGRAAKASTRCEPSPRQHPPPALTTTLTTAVEDLREEQRAGEPPAPSERKGGHPPLKTKLDGDSPSLTARPSKDGGRSGRAAKASTRCEPSPRQHPPPALTTTLTTAVEDLREEQRAGEPPAPSERKGGHPPLKTKLDGDSPSLTARPSKDGGRSGRAAKASTRCEPSPRQHPPPALTTTLTTAVEDLREEQRVAEPPAPSERKGGHPPLKTKLDGDSPDWREGERYEVLLGESFYREGGGGGGGGNSGGKNDSRVHYAHLKYDFIPGRTNLDAPAALRQGPFAGAGVKADVDSQRWAAEMVYESRDPENPRPVRFSGDAARYLYTFSSFILIILLSRPAFSRRSCLLRSCEGNGLKRFFVSNATHL